MPSLRHREPVIGNLDRLEEEVRIHEAAFRLMSADECSSMPEVRARLEHLRILAKAARRVMHLKGDTQFTHQIQADL
jgi:hypothetical protein